MYICPSTIFANMATFYKYQGTGNDFVMIDNRNYRFPKNNQATIAMLCDRRFGVGADGLILLENSSTADFKMVYFNADGNESTMCGNGGRCIVAFANFLNIIDSTTVFEAVDGLHNAEIMVDMVNLQMQDVTEVKVNSSSVFLDTGSPHHVQFETDIENFDIKTKGAAIRNEVYGRAGSNVNFVHKISDQKFKIRTYERGVENETLSCGTGATAVAIAMYHTKNTAFTTIEIQVEGGELTISFKPESNHYSQVFLSGKATQVFKGDTKW